MADLTSLSVEELEDKAREINERSDALREERRAVQAEVNRRHATAGVADLVAAMTPEERAQFVQTIEALPIPSTSVVGTPGE